jgi:hypothetical protein
MQAEFHVATPNTLLPMAAFGFLTTNSMMTYHPDDGGSKLLRNIGHIYQTA